MPELKTFSTGRIRALLEGFVLKRCGGSRFANWINLIRPFLWMTCVFLRVTGSRLSQAIGKDSIAFGSTTSIASVLSGPKRVQWTLKSRTIIDTRIGWSDDSRTYSSGTNTSRRNAARGVSHSHGTHPAGIGGGHTCALPADQRDSEWAQTTDPKHGIAPGEILWGFGRLLDESSASLGFVLYAGS